MKRFFLYMTAFLWPVVTMAQGPISPQLRALLDYYFQNAGESNSIYGFQIRDQAVSLVKLDVEEIATVFARRQWVLNTLNGYTTPGQVPDNEADPFWFQDKSNYVARSEFPGFVFDPKILDWLATNEVTDFWSGTITNIPDSGATHTNLIRVENGLIRSVEVY